MNREAIIRLAAEQALDLIDEIDLNTATDLHNGYVAVSGMCAIKLESTSPILDRTEDVAILDDAGAELATVCFTKGQDVDNLTELTAWRYVAFLQDIEEADARQGGVKRFLHDYVVVDEDRLSEYLTNYFDGAPIWGGFSHTQVEISLWTREAQVIQAVSGISVPTAHHSEVFHRYLNANNSFDRFLRLYHSVELLFDYITFRKIQGLDDDLVGYAAVMKDNGKTEFERLLAIISEYCLSHDALAHQMNLAKGHEVICRTIFQEYTKDSNPLKLEKFETFWRLVDGEAVSETNTITENLANANAVHKFLCKVAAYWIYRIRCSIAHNRVGEFILTDDHDNFVAELGIPLLQNVVVQILSNTDFKALTPAQPEQTLI